MIVVLLFVLFVLSFISLQTQADVDMQYNWWGDPSGPAPIGTGNPVNEHVDPDPWLEEPILV